MTAKCLCNDSISGHERYLPYVVKDIELRYVNEATLILYPIDVSQDQQTGVPPKISNSVANDGTGRILLEAPANRDTTILNKVRVTKATYR